MIDRDYFFDAVRVHPFGGRLSSTQVDGMNKILDEWETRALTDLKWLAYMLATTFHETAQAMVPIQECGSATYLHSKPYWPYIGEGLVQVTWKANYDKFGATGPGQLLQWPLALKALFDGMINGMFTGARLSTYFNAMTTDWFHARRIINGLDKAQLIAGYGKQFYAALNSGVPVS